MAMSVAIIDYGSGNLRSVEKAFERAARERGFAASISVTDDPLIIKKVDRIVLPGVGAFAACITGLRQRPGVIEALEHAVLLEARPFLGICVGMQLLAPVGEEFGAHDGLGWIDGRVGPLAAGREDLRIPHIGWNEIAVLSDHPVLENVAGQAFYFAHSYHFEAENDAQIIAHTDYGGPLTAAIARDNILGVQFHPEKSQTAGITLIGNFLGWAPS